ncbi:MAG: phosphotransferase [Stackebrandtia sp.]
MNGQEVPVPAGRMTTGITRRGGDLLRPVGPWTAAVHEYLRHLETAGYAGAPRVLGIEGDREVLSYLDGDVPYDPDWQPGRGHRLPEYARSESALTGVARLLRQLHDAAAGFRPNNVDYRFRPRPVRDGELIVHGDLGPWNTVYRDGEPVAFIDWDAAGPAHPLLDLGVAAWEFVPLAPRQRLRDSGFDPDLDLARRLRIFLDAYGLTDRAAILPALRDVKLVAVEFVRHRPLDAAEAASALRFFAAELDWLHQNTATLLAAL